jgi:hypothetical protein
MVENILKEEFEKYVQEVYLELTDRVAYERMRMRGESDSTDQPGLSTTLAPMQAPANPQRTTKWQGR